MVGLVNLSLRQVVDELDLTLQNKIHFVSVLSLLEQILPGKEVHLLHLWDELPQEVVGLILEKLDLWDNFSEGFSSQLTFQTEWQLIEQLNYLRIHNVIVEGVAVDVACDGVLQLWWKPCPLAEVKYGVQLHLKVVCPDVDFVQNYLDVADRVTIEAKSTDHPQDRKHFFVRGDGWNVAVTHSAQRLKSPVGSRNVFELDGGLCEVLPDDPAVWLKPVRIVDIVPRASNHVHDKHHGYHDGYQLAYTLVDVHNRKDIVERRIELQKSKQSDNPE